jgi:hypothetical protein
MEACCLLYGIRWWQERGFLRLKSAGFGWERSRITVKERIAALLVGVACATWLLWMLGRVRDHRPRLRPTTTTPQARRVNMFRLGAQVCRDVCTGRSGAVRLVLPPFRTLAYDRIFVPESLSEAAVMQ